MAKASNLELVAPSSWRWIALGQELGAGGAGTVFEVHGEHSVVVKIYHDTVSPKDLANSSRQLQAMLREPPDLPPLQHEGRSYVQIAWPTALVMRDGKFAGFSMPALELSRTKTLEYLLNDKQAVKAGLRSDMGTRVTVARHLAGVVGALHVRGHYVVDMKPLNLSYYPDTLFMAVLDCDGFNIHDESSGTHYPATMFTHEYLAPEFQVTGHNPNSDPEAQDKFALAVIIFQLLCHGVHPYSGILHGQSNLEVPERILKGYFPYGRTPHPNIDPNPSCTHWFLPDELLEYFDRAFGNDPARRPSAQEWATRLQKFASRRTRNLIPCKVNVKHRHFAGLPCSQCARENRAIHVAPPRYAKPPSAQRARVKSAPVPPRSASTSVPPSVATPPPMWQMSQQKPRSLWEGWQTLGYLLIFALVSVIASGCVVWYVDNVSSADAPSTPSASPASGTNKVDVSGNIGGASATTVAPNDKRSLTAPPAAFQASIGKASSSGNGIESSTQYEPELPDIRAGATYTYETITTDADGKVTSSMSTRQVTGVEGNRVIVAFTSGNGNPRRLIYDRQWNFVESGDSPSSGLSYNPPLKYFDFPLKSGKKWSEVATETNKKTGKMRKFTINAEVLGWENIGTLDGRSISGLKIAATTQVDDEGKRTSGTDISWYVPSVGRSVYSEITGHFADGKQDSKTLRLVNFTPWEDLKSTSSASSVLATTSQSQPAPSPGMTTQSPGNRPSFDCSRASTVTENAICTSPPLSRLDGELGRVYSELRSRASADQAAWLRTEQTNWLRSRDDSCKEDANCLGDQFRRRIYELKQLAVTLPLLSGLRQGSDAQGGSQKKQADETTGATIQLCVGIDTQIGDMVDGDNIRGRVTEIVEKSSICLDSALPVLARVVEQRPTGAMCVGIDTQIGDMVDGDNIRGRVKELVGKSSICLDSALPILARVVEERPTAARQTTLSVNPPTTSSNSTQGAIGRSVPNTHAAPALAGDAERARVCNDAAGRTKGIERDSYMKVCLAFKGSSTSGSNSSSSRSAAIAPQDADRAKICNDAVGSTTGGERDRYMKACLAFKGSSTTVSAHVE